jgi:5-methylcytosine-specific restriction endonuclease McrA
MQRTISSRCIVCESEFQYEKPDGERGRVRRVCGTECRRKNASRHSVKSRAGRPRAYKDHEHECKRCRAKFFSKDSRTIHCSRACHHAQMREDNPGKPAPPRPNQRKHATKRDRWQHANYKRRALVLAGEPEEVDRLAVFERDHWTCGICSMPVMPSLKWPHRECASIDHIVPLSKGGSHTYTNVQCAHYGCNSAKSDRLGWRQTCPEAAFAPAPVASLAI